MWLTPSGDIVTETYVEPDQDVPDLQQCALEDPMTGAICDKDAGHVPPHEARDQDFVFTFETPKELIVLPSTAGGG